MNLSLPGSTNPDGRDVKSHYVKTGKADEQLKN
jgi:hypothetical protein